MSAGRVVDESEISDQVWDETATDHVTAGSTGKKLADIATAIDALTVPTTGKIINLA